MARTYSTMLALGTTAPEFNLPDVVTGGTITLASFKDDKALLVMFICRHCPFVKHVQNELARLGIDYRGRGVGIVAISANDVANHPDDAPHHRSNARGGRAWARSFRRRPYEQVAATASVRSAVGVGVSSGPHPP